MGMEAIEIVYLVSFFLGLAFAILSALFSGVLSGGADAHVDVGGAHVDAGGGHVDASGGHEGSVHFSPLSPVTIAMFLASFGGAGILLKKMLHLPVIAHVPLAALSGFAVAGLLMYVFHKIFSVTGASSEARESEVIGGEAEVSVPIPNHGLGEISYTTAGTRFTNPARTVDGKELPAHVKVKVVQKLGTVFVVQRIP
jgi:membrane protein implicated in regulation of membrane protease activity